MQNDVRKPKHSAHKHRKGLTLERFATAKASGYNKQKKKDKQFALNAKKVNQYRKLQRKLQQSSTLPEVDCIACSLPSGVSVYKCSRAVT